MKPFLSVLVFSIFFTQLCLLSQATRRINSSHHNNLRQRHHCAKEDYSFLRNDDFLLRREPHRVIPRKLDCDNVFTCHLKIEVPSGFIGWAYDRSDVSWSRASGKPLDHRRFTPLWKTPGNKDVARISNPTDSDQGLYVLRHLRENWVLLFEVTLRRQPHLHMTMPPANHVQSGTDPNGRLIIASVNLPQRVAAFMCRIKNITLHSSATKAVIGLDRLRLTREQALYLVDTSGVQSGRYYIRIVLDNDNQLGATFQIDVSNAHINTDGPTFTPVRSPAVVPPHGVSPARPTAQFGAAQHNCMKVKRPVREDHAYSNRTDAEVVQTQILVCPARTDLDETVMMLVCKDWQNQSQVIVSFPNTVLDQSSVVELEHVLCKLNCSVRNNLILTVVVVLGSSVTKRLAIKLNMSAGLFQQLVFLLTPDGCTHESKAGSSTTTPTHTATATPASGRVQDKGKAARPTVPRDQSSEQTPTSTDTSNTPGNTGMAQEGGTEEGEDDSRSTKALQTRSTASPIRTPTSIGELLQTITALPGIVTRMLNIPKSSSTAVGKIIASAAAAADAERGSTFQDGSRKIDSPITDEVTEATYVPSRKPAVDAMTRTDLLPSDPGPHLSSAPADQQPTDQDTTSDGTVTLPTGHPTIQVFSATNQINEEEVPPQDSSSGTPDSIYLSIPVLFGIVLLLVVIVHKRRHRMRKFDRSKVIVHKRRQAGQSDTPEHRTADTKRPNEDTGADGGSDATSVDEPELAHPLSSEEDSKPVLAEPTVYSGPAFIPTAASSADHSPTRSPQDGGEQLEKNDPVQETEEADDPKHFSDSTARDSNIQEELTPSGTPVGDYLGVVGRGDGLATQLLSIQSVQHKTPGMSVEEEGPGSSPWQQHNNIPIACTDDDASRSAPKTI